ncbi:MAG: hypothetical protein OXE99_13215 [Cellvibrionales bacterium]|nr:hypothetical protein [Cellvibrionales bacterium]
MSDKGWMLSAEAISKARMCITIIQDELGIKLKLSHPDFLGMIKEYVELTESTALRDAYNELAKFAGQPKLKDAPAVIVPIKKDAVIPQQPFPISSQEMVIYRGKSYPKYQEGLEFKGLYRGQAHYA